MPGRAKSKAQKGFDETQLKEEMMTHALDAYLAILNGLNKGKPGFGLRKVCTDFNKICYEETGVVIKLSITTLSKRSEGRHTRIEAQAKRQWLTPTEEDVIVDFMIEMASRGWALSHRQLKEHAELILYGRLGTDFPEDGLGKWFTDRFLLRHSNRIKMADTHPLKDKCGRAVNPTTNDEYWTLLEDTIIKYKITPETTFGTDEISVQPRGDDRERVFTPVGHKGPQYKQTAGTHENTTVLVTICANSTTVPPAVIFKGAAYKVNWVDDNPINAS